MWGGTLPEKLALAASLLAAGCGSNHHVSPWGDGAGPSLEAFLRVPDLGAELARIDAETASLGLVRTEEIRAELPPRGSGRTAVLRGYEGRDVTGRKVHAVRVATPRGVVLAVGPLDAGDVDRGKATELVPALATGEGRALALRSGSDLNGDGALDVVLRNDAGALEIWRIDELGSAPYPVRLAAPPTRAVDADGDGRIDLWAELPIAPGDPVAPRFTDVATFAGGSYADDTPAARAWHAREARSPRPTGVSEAVRLRGAVEHAWHAILAGEPREAVLRDLGKEPASPPLRPWIERYQRTLASVRGPGPS